MVMVIMPLLKGWTEGQVLWLMAVILATPEARK
jgi:hypothetical protein